MFRLLALLARALTLAGKALGALIMSPFMLFNACVPEPEVEPPPTGPSPEEREAQERERTAAVVSYACRRLEHGRDNVAIPPCLPSLQQAWAYALDDLEAAQIAGAGLPAVRAHLDGKKLIEAVPPVGAPSGMREWRERDRRNRQAVQECDYNSPDDREFERTWAPR